MISRRNGGHLKVGQMLIIAVLSTSVLTLRREVWVQVFRRRFRQLLCSITLRPVGLLQPSRLRRRIGNLFGKCFSTMALLVVAMMSESLWLAIMASQLSYLLEAGWRHHQQQQQQQQWQWFPVRAIVVQLWASSPRGDLTSWCFQYCAHVASNVDIDLVRELVCCQLFVFHCPRMTKS